MTYYVPKTKRELVIWLSRRYPYAGYSFKSLDKRTLYAIYYNAIRKHEEIKYGT